MNSSRAISSLRLPSATLRLARSEAYAVGIRERLVGQRSLAHRREMLVQHAEHVLVPLGKLAVHAFQRHARG
jgi:hypothetical protein